MNTSASAILELCTDFELDDVTDLTIVISKKELETILAIDAAHGEREARHIRPTVQMPAVKVP